ncbi:MAG TPA: glycosyltransferase family 39 protein [Bryobacteraceae bacterium]|nr:glycosyltransferase family 39 protein [Bryobacteraceae bacterium]
MFFLRLPFLNQAIQGDDIYYLAGAEHALIDPAHPTHAKYVFQGELVDMRGHPHGPLDAWCLAALLWAFGDVREVPFHLAYIAFSIIAAVAMLSIARRFSAHPVAATLLFLVTPAFLVNGNSFESDIPFLAFWMAAIALFLAAAERRSLLWLAASAGTILLASLTSYQTVVIVPILGVYLWLHARDWRAGWIVAIAVAPLAIGLWQLYERFTSGALPATVLVGYFNRYGLQQVANKLRNATALTAHLGWIVSPLIAVAAFRRRWTCAILAAIPAAFIDPNPLFWGSFAAGVLILCGCVERKPDFLRAWIVIFFAAALVLFFAGSARYLLPLAAPVALLASKEKRWLLPAIAANLVLGLGLAWVNYQHWDGYRQFARTLAGEAKNKRIWINSEWGLRFYLESEGGLPLERGQAVQPGEIVVSSQLAYPVPVTTGGGVLTPLSSHDIYAALPLRLIALASKSGYSTASLGFRPFDISFAPIDQVRAERVLEHAPTLSWLPMDAPEAENQIVSGIYAKEGGWRWMSGKGVLLLKPPAQPAPLEIHFNIPGMAKARRMRVLLDGREITAETYPGPGTYTLKTNPVLGRLISIEVDQTFSVAGDHRDLGVILTAAGYR